MNKDRVSLRIKHVLLITRIELLKILKFLGLGKFLAHSSETLKKSYEKTNFNIDENNRNIIVLPNIPWSFRWQRPQQIFTRLAKKGFNIFYISPITSNEESITQISKNIYEVNSKTRVYGNVLRDFHLDEDNTKYFTESIKRLLGKYIQNDSLLFILHPVWKDVAFDIGGIKRVYDLMDLYSGFPDAREELVEAEHELISKSHMIICTASNLYDHAKSLNKNVHMIRNGSDYEKFSNLEKNGKLDCFGEKPIIGYFGAITDWLDFDLMEYVVKENREKIFIFIGSLNSIGVRKLYKYSNVYFLGEKNYTDLSGYLAYFDVCTIPFVLNDLIKSTNPVKFYEYIASGKPVVSVDLPELKHYSDICYLSNNKQEFSKNIFKALCENKEEIIEKRKSVAKENSWDRRVEELIKIID